MFVWAVVIEPAGGVALRVEDMVMVIVLFSSQFARIDLLIEPSAMVDEPAENA